MTNSVDVIIDMPIEPNDVSARAGLDYIDPAVANTRIPKNIVALTIDTGDSPYKATQQRPPARWRTPEFIFYAAVLAVVIPLMVWIPIQLSQSSHPQYPIYQRRLSQGWILGRRIDNSDSQYRSFRNNLPALCILFGFYFSLKRLYTYLSAQSSVATQSNLLQRVPFLCAFSFLMLLVLHGASAFKILVILSANFGIAKLCASSPLTPALTWIFNAAVLFGIERNSGYLFGSIWPPLGFLDALQGAYPRWYISFNITMLRLISFNLDYYWACRRNGLTDTGVPIPSLKQRTMTIHSIDVYSFPNYIAYVLYPPLYIAGPIMTFNDFMWQHIRPTSTSTSRPSVVSYLIRFISCFLIMELILHFMYVVAIKDTSAWQGATPFELSMIGFWNLIIVWLKLLIPWRFFRLWALVDGLDPPENMVRCMANNYSVFGFWRAWHRSYNLWIIRYIYIPLGGRKNVILCSILVFSFVALWHDLTFKLLAWGWLVSLFLIPEILATYLLPEAKYGSKPWYRHVCALGGVANIILMMTANLVGFAIGVDGMTYMAHELLNGIQGIKFLFIACACLFVGVQIMFEYREEEMRHGIHRKC